MRDPRQSSARNALFGSDAWSGSKRNKMALVLVRDNGTNGNEVGHDVDQGDQIPEP